MDEIIKPEIKKENLEEETLSPEIAKKASQTTRAVKSSKPLVEGINSPIVNSVNSVKPKTELTEAEKQLINSPIGSPVTQKVQTQKPLSEFMPPKQEKSKRVLWISLVGLMLVALAWGAFMWYNNKDAGKLVPVPVKQNIVTPVSNTQTNISSSTLQTNSNSLPPTTTPSTQTDQMSKQTNKLKVKTTPTGYLNVRATPSTAGKLLTKVYPGDVFTYTSEKNKWYEILLADGSTGWVTGQYVELVVGK